jgi:pyrimidine-nucleoside phosphorylase
MPIDLAVGMVLHKKQGDPVRAGEVLATLHANQEDLLQAALGELEKAFRIGPDQPARTKLIYQIME